MSERELQIINQPNLASGDEGVDPFYLFLDYVEEFSAGQVFLLDAAKESGNEECQMSIIGVLPVLELQAKDGCVTMYAMDGLAEHLRDYLQESGYSAVAHGAPLPSPSVVGPQGFQYTGVDPMAVLERVRICIRRLFPEGEFSRPFSSGLLGYIGYDAVQYLENIPLQTMDDRNLPDVRMQWHAAVVQMTPGSQVVHDALTALSPLLSPGAKEVMRSKLTRIQALLAIRQAGRSPHPQVLAPSSQSFNLSPNIVEDVSQGDYEESVRRAVEYIRAGDIFQVVISKRVRIGRLSTPYAAYEALRKLNPSPYMFMAEYPDMRLFGTSPEVQFRVVSGRAEMKPIAGSSKGRGKTEEEDKLLRDRLLSDEKERAEHLMLVDLCRNDLGRVCDIGSVHVPDFMVVEPYSHIHHIVSTVIGRLRADVSVFHALLATFPAGTLSGAPKIRAMEIIDELETHRRGPYGGMIGMVDFEANANTAIVIRTVVESGDHYYVQAGAGIVADSDPTQEWLECGRKAGAILDVLAAK